MLTEIALNHDYLKKIITSQRVCSSFYVLMRARGPQCSALKAIRNKTQAQQSSRQRQKPTKASQQKVVDLNRILKTTS